MTELIERDLTGQDPDDVPSSPATGPHDDGFDVPRSATVVVVKDDGGVIGT